MTIPNWLKTVLSFALVGGIVVVGFMHTPSDLSKDMNAKKTANSAIAYSVPLTIGTAHLSVALALTPASQEQGLSGTDNLADGTGMLFGFESPLIPHFWMKDMRYPLDMIWIDSTKMVIGSETKISQYTYPTTFAPKNPVEYVLEVPAGFVEKNNIQVGDTISF